MNQATATFGGGCFWCLEATFQRLKGVLQVQSGYAGGHLAAPGYRQVCTGETGHAEVVQLTYDPKEISYSTLLAVFFSIHDPTTLNRQGADVGSQYRSVIFYHSPDQHAQAHAFIEELTQSGGFEQAIVTELSPASTFYPAETEHDDYYNLHPGQGYCQMVIAPKIEKLKKRWQSLLQ